jgi:eukaryotic-like serine/threonine-protein kinase
VSVETLAGRYEVGRKLGRGGMASVFLARDQALGRPVAVKVLSESIDGDPVSRERFLREARLAARLSHPNVVKVFDAGEADGKPYIVMEYVPGETVAELLARRRRLSPAEAVDIIAQASQGIHHAHEHGLVHRDVKPQNLLVRDDGCVKVVDLGIARAAESTRLTQRGTILGTAAYLSPEQAAGEEVTAAADVYALGAVLYQLLTGRSPYEFDSLAELAAKQSSGEIVPPRDLDHSIPDPLEAVTMRALARDPRFRPASAAELAADLRAALDGRNTDTSPIVPLPRRAHVSVPGAGSWWLLAAAVAAAGALALVLALAHLGGSDSRSTPTTPRPAVAPIQPGRTAADEARNLSAWLRRYSR